jgi:hypothetical protein
LSEVSAFLLVIPLQPVSPYGSAILLQVPILDFFAAAVQGYLETPGETIEIHDNLFMAQKEYKSTRRL